MSSWMVHLKDGKTLTNKDPQEVHEVDSELITSVERVIDGKVISILKSPLIEDFFVYTEQFQLMMFRPGRQGGPPVVTARSIGCFLKDSDPPVQCVLSMDPRTGNAFFEAYTVRKKDRRGFGRRVVKRKRAKMLRQMARTLPVKEVDHNYLIINEPPVRRCYGLPNGIGCIIGVSPGKRVKAELSVVEGSVQLSFKQH